jgi:hypothetical protein
MERLPTGTWNKLKDRGIEVRKIQEKLGLRLEKNANQKLPRRYQYLAVEALDEGKITEGRFARLLRVNRLQARTLAERLRGRAGDITEEDLIDLDLGQSLERSGQ